jgi:2-keto-4-pentenoate hydratase/2-oxohepta-3-ene-1,7-dioic acid hydratase in catechol pathway
VKLGTVERGGAERVAVAVDDQRAVLLDSGLTMSGLIGDWAAARPAVQRSVGQTVEQSATVGVSDLEWLPPVPRPGKVICVARRSWRWSSARAAATSPATPRSGTSSATRSSTT